MRIISNHTSVLLSIPEIGRTVFIKIEDILYCKSFNNYTNIYTCDNGKFVVSKTLKLVENTLAGYGFIRSHRSYLINLGHISELITLEEKSIRLLDKIVLPISSAGICRIKNAVKTGIGC